MTPSPLNLNGGVRIALHEALPTSEEKEDFTLQQRSSPMNVSHPRKLASSTDRSTQQLRDQPEQMQSTSVVSTLMKTPEQLQGHIQGSLGHTIKPAIHNFFYPHYRDESQIFVPPPARGLRVTTDGQQSESAQMETIHAEDVNNTKTEDVAGKDQPTEGISNRHQSDDFYHDYLNDEEYQSQVLQDRRFVHHFWRTYDDIIILSLFTQVGILFRLAVSTYVTVFDSVFSNDSPLFVNLPLNCLSCFIMGMLCSGERLMEIISTRFTPARLQHDVIRDTDECHDDDLEYEDDDNDGDEEGDEYEVKGDQDTTEIPLHDLSENHNGSKQSEVADTKRRNHGGTYSTDNAEVIGDGIATSNSHTLPQPTSFNPPVLRRRRQRRGKREGIAYDRTNEAEGQEGWHRPRQNQRLQPQRKQRRKRTYFHSWQPPVHLDAELREVQLLALERRIRASKCLVLFPARKQDFDLMEHYFEGGYQKRTRRISSSKQNRSRIVVDAGDCDEENDHDDRLREYAERPLDLSFDLELHVEDNSKFYDPLFGAEPNQFATCIAPAIATTKQTVKNEVETLEEPSTHESHSDGMPLEVRTVPASATVACGDAIENSLTTTQPPDQTQDPAAAPATDELLMVEEFFNDMHANVTENMNRLKRVNLADGWDVGTTPDDMSDDLMLGLRDGFCGALSSFSSWNSAMVGLIESGKIGDAFIGYMLGIQLPIIAYRFGQHVAVFIFIWRCRFETRRDNRRGYGIRLSTNELCGRDSDDGNNDYRDIDDVDSTDRKIPSVRAIATALFVMALVTQCTSLSFFNDPENQQIALSLLFSPLGVLARWRLSKLNAWRPTFPLGTFTSNIVACLLSGSLGQVLAGNPGPRQRIVLVSFISGFGGTLSSLAALVVEILAGIDPVLFRFDGFFYAFSSLFWAWLFGSLFSSTADWADQTS